MTDPAALPPFDPRKPRRWLRWLLVASLALNLAVAGLALGAAIGRWGDRPRPPQDPADRVVRDLGFGPYARAVPRSERAALREAIRARRDALDGNRHALRAAFEASLQVLRGEPFDRAAMEARMAEQGKAIAASQAISRDILLDRLEAMSPEERAAFADRLERRLGREPRER